MEISHIVSNKLNTQYRQTVPYLCNRLKKHSLPTEGLESNPTRLAGLPPTTNIIFQLCPTQIATCNRSAKVGKVALIYYLLTSQNRRLDLFGGTNKLRTTFAGCTRNLHYKLCPTHKLINSIVQRSSIGVHYIYISDAYAI